jgi:DNA-binding PadR family transcriptional regulator
MSKPAKVDSILPLKPVDFLVLMVLAEQERHGYGIVQDIGDHTGGKIRLVPGNLYSVLRRLMGLGVIEEAPHRPAPDLDDGRRRYYRITGFGERVLSAEAERMRELVAAAESRNIIDRAEPAQ